MVDIIYMERLLLRAFQLFKIIAMSTFGNRPINGICDLRPEELNLHPDLSWKQDTQIRGRRHHFDFGEVLSI